MDTNTIGALTNLLLALVAIFSLGAQYRRDTRGDLQLDYERQKTERRECEEKLRDCEMEKERLRQRLFWLECWIAQQGLTVPNEVALE